MAMRSRNGRLGGARGCRGFGAVACEGAGALSEDVDWPATGTDSGACSTRGSCPARSGCCWSGGIGVVGSGSDSDSGSGSETLGARHESAVQNREPMRADDCAGSRSRSASTAAAFCTS